MLLTPLFDDSMVRPSWAAYTPCDAAGEAPLLCEIAALLDDATYSKSMRGLLSLIELVQASERGPLDLIPNGALCHEAIETSTGLPIAGTRCNFSGNHLVDTHRSAGMRDFTELMGRARDNNEYWEALVQNKIALQLSKILSRRGMSQTEFARVAGVSPAYVSRVLGGNENLSIKTLVKLTRSIGASLNVSVSLDATSFEAGEGVENVDDTIWQELERIAHKRQGSPKFILSIPQEAGNERVYRRASVETTDLFAAAA